MTGWRWEAFEKRVQEHMAKAASESANTDGTSEPSPAKPANTGGTSAPSPSESANTDGTSAPSPSEPANTDVASEPSPAKPANTDVASAPSPAKAATDELILQCYACGQLLPFEAHFCANCGGTRLVKGLSNSEAVANAYKRIEEMNRLFDEQMNFSELYAQRKKQAEKEQERQENLPLGSVIYYGRHEGKPMEWYILDVQTSYYPEESRKILLLSRDIVCEKPFYEGKNDEVVFWAKSTLRVWLNDQFIDEILYPGEQSRIVPLEIDEEGYKTKDRLFLLNISEADAYRDLYFESGRSLPDWWLRTMEKFEHTHGILFKSTTVTNTNLIATADYGSHGFSTATSSEGVRPAMWLDITDYKIEFRDPVNDLEEET